MIDIANSEPSRMTKSERGASSTSLIITLDGPSGSGKSTVSHLLAAHYQIPCLDTGAMYRTVALRASQLGVNLEDDAAVTAVAKKFEFRFAYEGTSPIAEASEAGAAFKRIGKEIRTPEVSMAASKIAKLKEVRKVLVALQQKIGAEHGAVVEGRDAGTVIFPQAKFKFFMTATSEERAKRRHKELIEKLGDSAPSLKDVLREMIQRDEQDSNRAESPLKPAADAQMIETTGLDMQSVLRTLISKIDEKRALASI